MVVVYEPRGAKLKWSPWLQKIPAQIVPFSPKHIHLDLQNIFFPIKYALAQSTCRIRIPTIAIAAPPVSHTASTSTASRSFRAPNEMVKAKGSLAFQEDIKKAYKDLKEKEKNIHTHTYAPAPLLRFLARSCQTPLRACLARRKRSSRSSQLEPAIPVDPLLIGLPWLEESSFNPNRLGCPDLTCLASQVANTAACPTSAAMRHFLRLQDHQDERPSRSYMSNGIRNMPRWLCNFVNTSFPSSSINATCNIPLV